MVNPAAGRLAKDSKRQNLLIAISILGMAILIAVAIGLAIGLRSTTAISNIQHSSCKEKIDGTTTDTSSGQDADNETMKDDGFKSAFGKYRMATVQSDDETCSKIGMDIMIRYGGSAMDSAIATVVCIGATIFEGTSIAGGHFMTVYDREKGRANKTVKTFLAREVGPLVVHRDYFKNHSSSIGGTSIGVPGTLHGLYMAWKMYGRVPWSQLVIPSVKLCEGGFPIPRSVAQAIQIKIEDIKKPHNTNLRALTLKPDGTPYKEGDILKRPKLARTLKVIAADPMSFYNGSLADDVVADIQEAGGGITKEDLRLYQTRVRDPIVGKLKHLGLTMYSPEPPSGGVVLQYLLRLVDGFGFNNSSLKDTSSAAMAYHKLIEAMKFAYGRRSALGDALFWNVTEVVANMTDDDFIDKTRSKIDLTRTRDLDYYDHLYDVTEDGGTSHLNVLAPDGSAVSMTQTVNLLFGSQVVGSRTGMIFNDQMDDFSVPGQVNAFNIAASPSNYAEPGKMPMSSMSPTLFLTENGNVAYSSGASGGSRIITAIANVALHHLYFNMDLKAASELPRLHHQLLPNYIRYEPGFDQDILKELQLRNHTIKRFPANGYCGVVVNGCATCENPDDCDQYCVKAVSDGRKGGGPYGY